ncbi:MAG: hypothetical protein GC136_07815 [Alphaproteobacteria bacterium]|nr:hypothetical protein [Alphaproteobacteria bacterium]
MSFIGGLIKVKLAAIAGGTVGTIIGGPVLGAIFAKGAAVMAAGSPLGLVGIEGAEGVDASGIDGIDPADPTSHHHGTLFDHADGTDIHGNPMDNNVHGNQPTNGHGNPTNTNIHGNQPTNGHGIRI